MNTEEQKISPESSCRKKYSGNTCATPSCIYGVAFIGAAIYFVQQADTFFWAGALGILKALVWPAILVYHALGFLQI
ncbi:MAG: hypothetical protein WC099_00620 [Candidatus Paceibacterota bacterium]